MSLCSNQTKSIEYMKQILFLTILAAMAVSCSSDEEREQDSSPVEIMLTTGVSGIQTKAPVKPNDNITATFVAATSTGNYGPNAWSSTVAFTASTTPTAALSFSPVRYYPVDGSSIFIKGYYPTGTLTDSTVTYSYTDGSVDLMISNEQSGTKTASAPLAFTFNHLLTQLQFKFVAGTGYVPGGRTVTGITLKTQKLPTVLNLNTGGITTYGTAADIALTGSYTISTIGDLAAVYPMVKAGEALNLDIKTSDNVVYSTGPITLSTVAGQAHLVTLTFTPKEITSTVKVTDWVPGAGGSSPLQ